MQHLQQRYFEAGLVQLSKPSAKCTSVAQITARAGALAEIESILAEPENFGTREFHEFARELKEKAKN